MPRNLTIGEKRWPNSEEFSNVADKWFKNASTKLLSFVWQGYELLKTDILSKVEINKSNTEDIERSITQYLEPSIRKAMTGDEPFYVQHGTYEEETRVNAKAQPPQYDIAFCLHCNPRIIWPLEAKVLTTDGTVTDYITDVTDQFLTCRYAPFSSEAGMLGYLLSGDAKKVFKNITTKLNCPLTDHPDFLTYNHKMSNHQRTVPMGKSYPINFKCHHLILIIS